MNTVNIICTIIFILAIGIVGGIKIYQVYKKNDKKLNLKEFIDKYGDQIISILKDVVKLLKVSESNYKSKEEYEKEIIEVTIDEIKQNYERLGISVNILSLLDSETLSTIIYDLLHKNAINIFSVLDTSEINDHKYLYDDKVISAVSVDK